MLQTILLLLLPACYQQPTIERTLVQTVPASVYQYDTFRDGVVTFRNGSRQRAKLNYNCALAKLAFIDGQGDTLLLTNKIFIRHVLIDNKQYLPGKRDEDDDLEVVATYPEMRLARTVKAVVGGTGANASTQQFKADSTSTVPNSLLLVSQGRDFQWQNNASENVLRQKAQLFFVDNNERMYRASYRSLIRLMRQQKAGIDQYMNRNVINFDDLLQVKTLIESVH